MAPKYHIGTSGFHYDHWRERFYPPGLPKSKWLAFYAGHFATVELNSSFYRLPSEKAFATWRESSPTDFTFAVKVSRFITHMKKLRDVDEALAIFLGRARGLGQKLGPLLYQLPPNVRRNDEVLEAFLAVLPSDLDHAFEFRHRSWFDQTVFDILHRHGAAFCSFHLPGLPCPLVATADFAYIRFHGSEGKYWGRYTDEELAGWAERIAGLARDLKAVYIYFNNDDRAFAVHNALTLEENLARIVRGSK